jgi:hypothetical protein
MSARMLPAVWILAVFAVLLCSPGATAQPPDLLGNPKGDCTPEARPADMRPFMRCCLIGLNPAAGLFPVDFLIDLDDERPVPVPAVEPRCPYLKKKKNSKAASTIEPVLGCDFQQNLNKLSEARKLYEKGQARLRDGDHDGALYFFARIHELVPGSRFDSQATEQINTMARQGLAPTVPPIDPKILDALQKLLKESGNPTVPRLIIHVEEQSVGEEEEPAVPSEWSDEPSAVEVPRLLVDPADDQLTLTPEEDEPAEPEEFSKEAWSALLRDAIEAIRSGLGVEVEMTVATPNVSQREHFGGIEIEVTIGSGGEQFVKVSLSPETSGDLRAAQRAHNERILNWIERLNEPCADEDDSAAEEEDATYGDEPRNEAIP